MEEKLKLAYAKCMVEYIPALVKWRCRGCNLLDINTGELYDHPSQDQHDVCLTMSLAEKIDLCFDEALEEVDDTEELYLFWFKELAQMDPPPNFLEYSKYLSKDWRQVDWINQSWRDSVTQLMLQNI